MADKKLCPICGCSEIGQGINPIFGILYSINKFLSCGSEVIADICTNCGHILSMRVLKPEKFK